MSAAEFFLNMNSDLPDVNDAENERLAQRLYGAAMKAAELTWSEGLLLKGNSMCHGISGNSLLLHSVARWHNRQSQDKEAPLCLPEGSFAMCVKKYQLRALMFARAMSLESV